MDPDPIPWRKELDEQYKIEEIMIFGDFSYTGINTGLDKLRAISNTAISTQQPHDRHKKDMTDFIMLDYYDPVRCINLLSWPSPSESGACCSGNLFEIALRQKSRHRPDTESLIS